MARYQCRALAETVLVLPVDVGRGIEQIGKNRSKRTQEKTDVITSRIIQEKLLL